MQLLELTDFNEDTIKEIINSSLEESINIEFKSSQALSKDNKKEISKDISAFANSDGGLIFYGIHEENHVATSVSFIDGNVFTKEWLENVIISNIQPKITELRIIPIRFGNDIAKTIYVVKIPNSYHAPHINGDKRYYRRFNFQSVPMEEYEIKNLYLRQKESKVYFKQALIKSVKITERNTNEYSFNIDIQIGNSTLFVAEKYKVACNFKNATMNISYDRSNNYNVTRKGEEGVKISNNDMIPLFPNELLSILNFNIHIPKEEFYQIMETLEFKIIVFNVAEEIKEFIMNIKDYLIEIKEQYY